MSSPIAYLHVTTFRALCADASHFYARITFRGEYHQVLRTLDAVTAAEMTRIDRSFRWNAGDQTSRLGSEEQAVCMAQQVYKDVFPEAIALFRGYPSSADPMQVLDGPRDFVQAANALNERADACGRWDEGHMSEMRAICKEWDRLLSSVGDER